MTENGFEYVDLGLSSGTMWATCNVGATKPEDEGLLFQFGRVDGYKYGSYNQFRTNDQNEQDTGNRYIPLTTSGKAYKKNEILDLEDDAAHVNMGGAWRMPTGRFNLSTRQYEGEWGELLKNTSHNAETINGVKGMMFTSNINEHQLFIPFIQGYWYNGNWEKNRDGLRASVWSSQVHDSYGNNAYKLYCSSNDYVNITGHERTIAFSVRSVFNINEHINNVEHANNINMLI